MEHKRRMRDERWLAGGVLGVLGVLVVSIWMSGCGREPVVARYHGGEISRAQYESWRELYGLEDDPDARERNLVEMASRQTLAEAAQAAGRGDSLSVRMALLDAEAQRLARALGARRKAGIEIAPEVLEQAIEEAAQGSHWPKRVRLRNLFKRTPPGASPGAVEALRSRMRALRGELAAGADFALLAAAESESQTRFRGGMMGFIKPGQLDPKIEAIAFGLEPGALSPVIETPDGFTLLRCEEVREATVQDPDQVRARVLAGLRKKRSEALDAELSAQLLAGVEIDLQPLLLTSAPQDAIVIRVEGRPMLRANEVRALFRHRGFRRPLTEVDPAALETRIKALAVSLRASDRARGQKIDRQPEVAQALRWDRLGILASEEIAARVQQRFVPLDDQAVRAQFEAHPRRYRWRASFQLAAIALRAGRNNLRAQHARARRIAGDLAHGRVSFADAAAANSELPSASHGGMLGWLSRQRVSSLGPSVWAVVQRLEPGQISELVEQQEDLAGDTTLWILELIDRKPARPMRFEEARRRAKNDLGNQRLRELEQQVLAEVEAGLDLVLQEPWPIPAP